MSNKAKKLLYTLSVLGSGLGGLALIRSYVSGSKYEGTEEMYGKTVIITGANRGIGKETAKDLSRRGAKVIMACRDMEACEKTRQEISDETFNKRTKCLKCDLSSLKSIDEFVNTINKEEKYVNVLINNAGVMWAPQSVTEEGFERHLGVNHLGHFYLTNKLIPKLQESSSARVITVTCRDAIKGTINYENLNSDKDVYNEEIAYNQSKLANLLFNLELSDRLKGTNVIANCVDPGYVQTDLMRHSSIHQSPYSPVSIFFKAFVKTPVMGAQSVIAAAISKKFDNVTGKCIRGFDVAEIEKEDLNKENAVRLWKTSEYWTRLQKSTV